MRLFKKKRTRSNGLIKGGGGLYPGDLKPGGLKLGFYGIFLKMILTELYKCGLIIKPCSIVWGEAPCGAEAPSPTFLKIIKSY